MSTLPGLHKFTIGFELTIDHTSEAEAIAWIHELVLKSPDKDRFLYLPVLRVTKATDHGPQRRLAPAREYDEG